MIELRECRGCRKMFTPKVGRTGVTEYCSRKCWRESYTTNYNQRVIDCLGEYHKVRKSDD